MMVVSSLGESIVEVVDHQALLQHIDQTLDPAELREATMDLEEEISRVRTKHRKY